MRYISSDSTDYLLGGNLVMKFAFNYYNKDHLGDNREVVNASGVVQQVTNYYPFGATYADAAGVKNADLQQYKYNGKEFDKMHGLNTYDYGARQHDPILARWDRIDPLCEKYYSVTPYVYCVNNPVRNIDPDGRDYYRSDDGAVFWNEGNQDFVESEGVRYRNIGESYSTYHDGYKYTYNQGEFASETKVSSEFNLEGGQYIPNSFVTDDGTKVKVTFRYNSATGGNGNKALNPNAVSLLISGVNNANNDGANIDAIDISCTTNGQHSKSSNHYISNGATAMDIDQINNTSIRNPSSRSQTNQLQKGFEKTGGAHQNIGPEIQKNEGENFKKYIGGHNNHIHIDAR